MKILGIDPGLNNLAYAFLEVEKSFYKLKDWQTFNTKNLKNISDKLVYLYNGLKNIIENYQPDYIALEEVFAKTYPTASAKLAQAQAIVLLIAGLYKIPVKIYHPSEIKKIFTQNGKAKKDAISRVFNLFFKNGILEVETLQKEDNHKIDALALALLLALELRD